MRADVFGSGSRAAVGVFVVRFSVSSTVNISHVERTLEDLLAAGKGVSVAHDFDISDKTIYS